MRKRTAAKNKPWPRLIHGLWLLVLLLGIYEVKRNELYRIFVRGEKYIFSHQWGAVELSVSLPYRTGGLEDSPDARYRVLKLSFPFGALTPACDQLYGLAVYNFERAGESPRRRRLLFNFAYDVPNGRCESKHLFLDDLGNPESIDVQLIDIHSADETLTEVPRAEGLRIGLQGRAFDPLTISFEPRTFAPSFPFISSQRTPILTEFSANPAAQDAEALISPRDDLQAQLTTAFTQAIERCRRERRCEPVRAAVARIDDDEFAKLFVAARQAGIDTEVLISFRPWIGRPDVRANQPLNELEPLEWLADNPYIPYRRGLRLPMHTKFISFGDRLVFSGINLYFDRYPYARVSMMKYSDVQIGGMFQELFTRIKSANFTPKRIDLRKSFSLMLGGEKMQRIAAIRRSVSPGVITEEGLKTSAYGVALYLMDDAQSSLTLSMSPLSDGCHEYRTERCLYDVLARKFSSVATVLYENPFFFASKEQRDQRAKDFIAGGFAAGELPRLQSYVQALGVAPTDIVWQKLPFGFAGTYHHRMAVVDHDTIIGGSANLAHELTLNTVEVLRSPALATRIEAALKPQAQRYYISPIRAEMSEDEMRHFARDGNCLFVPEYSLFGAIPPISSREYSFEEVQQAVRAQYPTRTLPSAAQIAQPKHSAPNEALSHTIVKSALSPRVSSQSQDLCIVLPGSAERLIVKMPGETAP